MPSLITTVGQQSIALTVVLGLLVAPMTSQAYFSNLETASGQRFVATELILDMPDTLETMVVGPGVATLLTRTLPIQTTEASTQSVYQLTSTALSSDGLFCDALTLTITLGATSISDSPETLTLGDLTEYGNWTLQVDYDVTQHDFATGATCTITIEVETWQANMTQATAGYRDVRTVSLVVSTDMSLVSSLATAGTSAPVTALSLTQLSILLDTDEEVVEPPVEEVPTPVPEEPVVEEPPVEELPEESEVPEILAEPETPAEPSQAEETPVDVAPPAEVVEPVPLAEPVIEPAT